MSGAKASPPSRGTLAAGARHLRQEWGRWWRTDDLTDTHIAHAALNDQYRLWRGVTQRSRSDVRQNISLLKRQQRQQQAMQMQRMAAMRQMQRSRGGRGYGGFGLGLGMMGGASPMVTYRTMQWAELEIKIGQKEFEPSGVTPGMLAAGRSQARARRHRAALAWIVTLPLLWLGLWLISPAAGLVVTGLAALALLAVAWSAGRNPARRRPPVPKLLFVPPKPVPGVEEEADPEPFALREAGRTPRVAREAVDLALRREAIEAEVAVPEETPYGWLVPLTLGRGTVGDVVRAVPQLATTLQVGQRRILARAADPDNAARVDLRVLLRDPWAEPLPYPKRTPRSGSIRRPVSLGMSLEGETTPVVLFGQHMIIVGDTGSGKSAMVQAIADFVTSCEDAVAVDIDPAKRGLRSLSDAAVRRARTPAEAEAELEWLLNLAQERIASLPPTQETWEPTPEAPAVTAFLDEYPRLTKRGKELAVAVLRISREAGVNLVIITQDATQDVLGDAVADAVPIRIMLACRAADVPLVVGRADAISQGWLPHLLVPSTDPEDPADAGRFYCITPRHRDPVLRYVAPLPAPEAARRAQERRDAGLPPLTAPAPQTSTATADLPQIARELLGAFAAAGDPAELTVGTIADHLVATDPEAWGRWEHRKDRRAMIGRRIREQLKAADLDVPTVRTDGPGRPTAYRLAAIRDALHARLS